jgi:hypothetical protein
VRPRIGAGPCASFPGPQKLLGFSGLGFRVGRTSSVLCVRVWRVCV